MYFLHYVVICFQICNFEPYRTAYFTLKQEETKEITQHVYAALSDVIKDWDKDLKEDFEDVE